MSTSASEMGKNEDSSDDLNQPIIDILSNTHGDTIIKREEHNTWGITYLLVVEISSQKHTPSTT